MVNIMKNLLKEECIMISSLDFEKLTREEKIDMYKFFVSQHVLILSSMEPIQTNSNINDRKINAIKRIDYLILQCAESIDGES